MSTNLKSDLLRTAVLFFALLLFPLFIRQSPPPQSLLSVASWPNMPLNAALADTYYSQAFTALQAGNIDLEKSWLVSAIQVDPKVFSPRYKKFIDQRTQWMAR